VASHVTELRRHAPQAVPGYLAMARATADRALAHGLLKPEAAEHLLEVLADVGAARSPTDAPGRGPTERGDLDRDPAGDPGSDDPRPEDPGSRDPGPDNPGPDNPRP